MSDVKVLNVVDNADGTCTIEFDVSEEFKKSFKEAHGLKRFSQKKFQQFVLDALDHYMKEKR
jgi:hypothetical protein